MCQNLGTISARTGIDLGLWAGLLERHHDYLLWSTKCIYLNGLRLVRNSKAAVSRLFVAYKYLAQERQIHGG